MQPCGLQARTRSVAWAVLLWNLTGLKRSGGRRGRAAGVARPHELSLDVLLCEDADVLVHDLREGGGEAVCRASLGVRATDGQRTGRRRSWGAAFSEDSGSQQRRLKRLRL